MYRFEITNRISKSWAHGAEKQNPPDVMQILKYVKYKYTYANIRIDLLFVNIASHWCGTVVSFVYLYVKQNNLTSNFNSTTRTYLLLLYTVAIAIAM